VLNLYPFGFDHESSKFLNKNLWKFRIDKILNSPLTYWTIYEGKSAVLGYHTITWFYKFIGYFYIVVTIFLPYFYITLYIENCHAFY